jgi:hypothetical protein
MAGSSPVLGTRHQRRAYLPGRQLCEPWQHQPPKPPSKRPIGTDGIVGIDTIIGTDGIVGIIGTDGIVGTDIGTVAIIGIDTIIGVRITVAIIITTGVPITCIPIIGNGSRT